MAIIGITENTRSGIAICETMIGTTIMEAEVDHRDGKRKKIPGCSNMMKLIVKLYSDRDRRRSRSRSRDGYNDVNDEDSWSSSNRWVFLGASDRQDH